MAIVLKRQPVKSAIMRSLGYIHGAKILEMEFIRDWSTGIGVSLPKIYEDLMHSGEPGKYFSEKVRPRFWTKQVGA